MPRKHEDWVSPLKQFLDLQSISEAAFAETLGVTESVVRNWTQGGRLPTLPFLYEIERMTSGAVPLEVWVVHPDSTAAILKMRKARGEG